jgi:hypothetical protein
LLPPMGEDGGAGEMDETYIGRVKGVKMKRGGSRHKNAVLSLLDRKTGQVRSFHIAGANAGEIAPDCERQHLKGSAPDDGPSTGLQEDGRGLLSPRYG